MKNFVLFLLIIVVISCKKETAQEKLDKINPLFTTTQKHVVPIHLNPATKKEITPWKEYSDVDSFLQQFSSISPNEALNNALELAKLAKLLKDSIRPKELQTPSFKTRVNVFENEILRLKDMTYISAITAEEVNQQVTKILEGYSATNSKINTVFTQISLEREVELSNVGLSIKKISRKGQQLENETPLKRKNISKQ